TRSSPRPHQRNTSAPAIINVERGGKQFALLREGACFCMNNETKPDQKKSGKKLPINLFSDRKIQGSSGFIIVRLAANVPNPGEDLRKFPNFAAILNQHEGIVNRRLIRSVKPERLLEMEKKAAKSEFPPLHSLTSYWRIDCRKL